MILRWSRCDINLLLIYCITMATTLQTLMAVAAMVAGAGVAEATADWQPRHVHLAYGHTTTEVVVTWSTLTSTDVSTVEWGTDMFGLASSSQGEFRVFVDGGILKSTQYIHRVHLYNLLPNTNYFYHVGSDQGWSAVFGFKTVPEKSDGEPLRLAVYGDLGTVNGQSLVRLQQESHQGMYDAVLHVGDMAYDMYMNNGHNGDLFMEQIEPIAAYLPYMTCPGNHEQNYDFLQYRSRFSMPDYNTTESLHYSFDIGLVHFVAISTEVYYYAPDIEGRTGAQYQWLVADLEAATTPEARAERPWIILFGHHPMYCSTNDGDDCIKPTCRMRVGLPGSLKYGLEPLLAKYGVDLAVWAHEHTYERLYPVYNFTVMKGSEDEPYTNPKAPVQFITGSAGCIEKLDTFLPKPDWSAVRVSDYGYTRVTVHNKTHLHWEQVSDDQEGVLTDSVWLVRDKHDSYNVD